jgi:hypothetical protein
LQGGEEYAAFQEHMPLLKCFTKCCRIKLGGTIFNGPPGFIQKLHSDIKEASIAPSVEFSGATLEQCKVQALVTKTFFSTDSPVSA